MAFPLAIVDEVNNVAAEHAKQPFLVGYRISPEEETTPGITGVEDKRSRMEMIYELVGQRVPVIGVGSIRTPDEALGALQTGVPFIALGRELIIDPDWVDKITQGKESEIRTEFTLNDQEKLGISDHLWKKNINVPGWFPIANPI